MASDTPARERERLYKALAGKPEIVHVPEMSFRDDRRAGGSDHVTGLQGRHRGTLCALLLPQVRPQERAGTPVSRGPARGSVVGRGPDSVRHRSQGGVDVDDDDRSARTRERFEVARDEIGRKKELPAIARARLERFEEGSCPQVLHVGPFSAEGPIIAMLHAFIQDQGYSINGKHHEIYLSDPRRSAPEKWKTIIRQPFSVS